MLYLKRKLFMTYMGHTTQEGEEPNKLIFVYMNVMFRHDNIFLVSMPTIHQRHLINIVVRPVALA
jgi:hypothetical protein